MSEIHPAIKLVIHERIRRLFMGNEILSKTDAIANYHWVHQVRKLH